MSGLTGPGLADTADVRQLIPGDPDALAGDARVLEGVVDTLTTVAEAIGDIDLGGWVGNAADAYVESAEPLRTSILVAATALSDAAGALRRHADTVEWAQGQARAAVRQYEAAALCMASTLGPGSVPAGQVRANEALARAREEVFASGNSAAAVVEAATVDAPINPGFWNQVGYQWSQFWQGGAESLTGLGRLVWEHNNIRMVLDPTGWMESNDELAAGLAAAAQDPCQLAKDLVDWDTWATNPARAAGHLLPDAIVTAVTLGAGAAATRSAGAAAKVATAAMTKEEAVALALRAAPEPLVLEQAATANSFAHHIASGAEDAMNGVNLRAQLTGEEIAGGHAFQKHVIEKAEFPGIATSQEFASHIEDVVMKGEMRTLARGRTVFWYDRTVVIRSPTAIDGGTAFRPTGGYKYFLNLK